MKKPHKLNQLPETHIDFIIGLHVRKIYEQSGQKKEEAMKLLGIKHLSTFNNYLQITENK